jgi:hypothetical protein
MSLPFRQRTGLILVGLVMSVPLLGAPADADTATITFSGQPLLGAALSCPSTPSQTTLTVAAGTVVDFVNRTGRQATLWADDAEKSLPDRSLVPVTFNGGPSSEAVVVQMLPDCSLDLGKHIQMTVTVLAQVGAVTPAPTKVSTVPVGGGATATAASHPSSSTTAGRTPGSTPSESKSAGAVTGASGDNDPFQQAPSQVMAAKPLIGTAIPPAQPRSASGLLTLIATVGVVGVSVAAIRAIVSQRAIRALVA